MNIAVIGTGYVGLNTAAALAYISKNNNVIGIDVDQSKVDSLNNRIPTISEQGLSELLSITADNLSFTTDYNTITNSDVIFIAVGTPSNPDGSANMDYVNSVTSKISNISFKRDVVIVIKSTVPIGSNYAIERTILNNSKTPNYIHFASNPEFLREGTALLDTFYPDRIIIGSHDNYSTYILKELYKPILNREFTKPSFISDNTHSLDLPQILVTDQISAEMIKYASNCFLAVKISYANEISNLANMLGANMHDISTGMGMDKRIAPYFLNSGLGWGGSCFPKDTLAILSIARDYNISLPIIQSAVDVNNSRIPLLISKLLSRLKTLSGKTITLFGITFKPNTDDVRNSLAADLAIELKRRGANVIITDPAGIKNSQYQYNKHGFKYEEDPYLAVENTDALIISTEWNEYKHLDFCKISNIMRENKSSKPVLIDARNILYNSRDKENFDYISM